MDHQEISFRLVQRALDKNLNYVLSKTNYVPPRKGALQQQTSFSLCEKVLSYSKLQGGCCVLYRQQRGMTALGLHLLLYGHNMITPHCYLRMPKQLDGSIFLGETMACTLATWWGFWMRRDGRPSDKDGNDRIGFCSYSWTTGFSSSCLGFLVSLPKSVFTSPSLLLFSSAGAESYNIGSLPVFLTISHL